eukprot:g26181.t1
MMVLRHGMEVSAIKHGKVESWALCRKDFGKEETFRHLQTEEAAWRRSLEAEYLRLRTSDGNFATKLNFLESKIQQLEARPAGFAVEPKPKASQQVEDWRPHLAELRGSFETLEARLSQQLSQQLETQLSGIIQMQLQTHVQPQLQQQLQSQLTQLQDPSDRCAEFPAFWSPMRADQDIPGLRETELKHIFQEKCPKLAAQAFSSSSVMQRLQLVENELQSLQRQEKERHKRRIARLEEDLAQSPMPSPLTSPALSKREVGNDGDVIHRIDELRVQLYAELSDARNVATQLGSRVSRCESEILDLRMQVALNGAEESQTPVRTPSFAQGSPTVEGCPKTPDWASPWQAGQPKQKRCRVVRRSVFKESSDEDSPGRVPSTRFGVLPPPKVTTEAPTL